MLDSAKLAEEGVTNDRQIQIVMIPRTDAVTRHDIPLEVQTWLRDAHGSRKGHLGHDATVRNLFENRLFRTAALNGRIPRQMDEFVRQWLRTCDACQKMSVKKATVQAEHFTCSTYVPMQRVAIDYIEKLTIDRWGNDMIVVIIDCFSRFITLYPVHSTRAKVFADTFVN